MLRVLSRTLALMPLQSRTPVGRLLFIFFASIAVFAQSPAKPPLENISLVKDAAQAFAAGDSKRAESELNTVLATEPNEFHALNLLGIIRAQQRREPEAETLLKRAIEIKPDFASAHVSLGMLYVQIAKPDDAIPQFQQALRLDPERTDARSSLVNVWRDRAHAVAAQDPEKALALLIQARKADPKDADVQYDFGMVALRMSLLPDAKHAFQQALSLRKDDATALYGLGRTEMALAEYEDAQATFRRYCELRPGDASGHYALGVTLAALQRWGDARSQFERSIEIQPAQTESYFQIGRIDLEAGDLPAAEAQFTRVLKRDPHHAGALAGMGRARFQQKDYAPAADFLQKAIAADASLREAHYYLGMTYARMNRKEDSEKEQEIATRLEHEEVEKHRNGLKIIDSDQVSGEQK
ncbi:MAG: tetratricopeptide repeat protein [Candidatus Sulfotelmatobacter sp.]